MREKRDRARLLEQKPSKLALNISWLDRTGGQTKIKSNAVHQVIYMFFFLIFCFHLSSCLSFFLNYVFKFSSGTHFLIIRFLCPVNYFEARQKSLRSMH